ncbi:MAG TPA: SDR family NAD(P)-dependent oxidoreductase [Candidatus Avalokitesvara rifleensis]|uniref:SDR family NAD(P)-dependent oxidoreductase n=1 Tax=Candidatus Avalokitesvara rifleensis TaxID=3367620 RepID=UPI0040280DC5
MRLKDKVALITGGGTGIGRATAIVFAKEGAKVAVTGRRKGPLEETVSVIKSGGGKAVMVEGDVSVAKDAERMVKETTKVFGRLNILVNNAGVNYKSGGTVETDEDGWDVVMDINVKGVYLVSRSAVPKMENTGGSIINMASIFGIVGYPKAVAYCASKGAVVNLTRSMALDLAERKIRVNCICPGVVDTPMAREWMEKHGGYETVAKEVSAQHPLGRLGEPEDIAYACLYLASDEASWVTGAILPVDGGFTAK